MVCGWLKYSAKSFLCSKLFCSIESLYFGKTWAEDCIHVSFFSSNLAKRFLENFCSDQIFSTLFSLFLSVKLYLNLLMLNLWYCILTFAISPYQRTIYFRPNWLSKLATWAKAVDVERRRSLQFRKTRRTSSATKSSSEDDVKVR